MENKEKKEEVKELEGDDRIFKRDKNQWYYGNRHNKWAFTFCAYLEQVLMLVLWNPRMRIYVKYVEIMDELESYIEGVPYMHWYDSDRRDFYRRVKRLRYLKSLIDKRLMRGDVYKVEIETPNPFEDVAPNGVLYVPSLD